METLLSDVKYGLRLIIKNPVFSLVVVVALALGIGANTAIFSVLNAVLLKPLPYADSEHLVMMWQRFTGIGVPKDQNWTSPPEFSDVRRLQSSFSDIAGNTGNQLLHSRRRHAGADPRPVRLAELLQAARRRGVPRPNVLPGRGTAGQGRSGRHQPRSLAAPLCLRPRPHRADVEHERAVPTRSSGSRRRASRIPCNRTPRCGRRCRSPISS